jgi:Spy/CpxP family protein refolding chaperone
MNPKLRFTLFLALAALPLVAQTGPAHGPRMERLASALHLTEAQKAGIRSAREKHRHDLTLRRDAVQHARIDLRTALQDPATPEAQLRGLYDKATAARFELILARRSLQKEVQTLLTPEQRAEAAEFRAMHQARMREHLRRRGPWAQEG